MKVSSVGLLRCALLAAVGVSTAFGQITNFKTIHSFGIPAAGGIDPRAGLIVGSDGALYGTASRLRLSGLAGAVFRIEQDGSGYRVLRHFGGNDGAMLEARMLEGSDGVLYGTASRGGTLNRGTIFRLNKDGTQFSVLRRFAGTSDGNQPIAALIEASNGMLYGTTRLGGTPGEGTIFRLNKDGSGYAILHEFGQDADDGRRPLGGLLQDSTGAVFGTVSEGGTAGRGGVFKIGPDGTGYVFLRSFAGPPDEPEGTDTTLIEGPDGTLYGTSRFGGSGYSGTVFKINKDGGGFAVLRAFTPLELDSATEPSDALFFGTDGRLYGTAAQGGNFSGGIAFAMDTNGSNFLALHHFGGFLAGASPRCALLLTNGFLYGTTVGSGTAQAGGTIFRVKTNGTDYSRLWNFSATGNDVYAARKPLVRDTATSEPYLYGGSDRGGSADAGAVFKLNLDGSGYTLLRSFGTSTNDGVDFSGGVMVGSDGYLYGVTRRGGDYGAGVIFRMGKDGVGYHVLRHLGSAPGDPAFTAAALIEGSDGSLYGGSPAGGETGVGTLFRINRDGTDFAVIHSFQTEVNGSGTSRPLTEGTDGMLYGTASGGGATLGGTLFRLDKNGGNFAVMRHFSHVPDASGPHGPLLLASDGWLYGVTTDGGSNNLGTLYRINSQTNFAIVLHFGGDFPGRWPAGALVEGPDGKLYGTTRNFAPETGTLFRVNKDGTGSEVLVNILSGSDASNADAGLVAGADGALYGMSTVGGDSGLGTIFRFGHMIGINAPGALEVAGIPGYTYSLQRSIDLRTWSTLVNIVVIQPSTAYNDLPLPASAAFYKLRTP